MEMERCSFSEAVEILAERAHLPLPQMVEDEDYERRRSRRERLLRANTEAARFYHDMLFKPGGAPSLQSLRGRGLSDPVIRRFGLGAAPEDWSVLTDTLLERGYTLEEMQQFVEKAGLSFIEAIDADTHKGPDDNSERIYIIARENGKRQA